MALAESGNIGLSEAPMISIVDDDESVRESTKALVRSLGYSARTFSSAEEFLDSNPDETNCLILDIQMKGLSGVELLERPPFPMNEYATTCLTLGPLAFCASRSATRN
jgi:FixJ family two-component response regulator